MPRKIIGGEKISSIIDLYKVVDLMHQICSQKKIFKVACTTRSISKRKLKLIFSSLLYLSLGDSGNLNCLISCTIREGAFLRWRCMSLRQAGLIFIGLKMLGSKVERKIRVPFHFLMDPLA